MKYFLLIILLQITLFALPPEIEADRALLYAKSAVENGNYSEAKIQFEKVMKLGITMPNKFRFHYGKVLVETGDYSKARANIEKYLSVAGKSGDKYIESLELLNKLDKLEEQKAVKDAEIAAQEKIRKQKEERARLAREERERKALIKYKAEREHREKVAAVERKIRPFLEIDSISVPIHKKDLVRHPEQGSYRALAGIWSVAWPLYPIIWLLADDISMEKWRKYKSSRLLPFNFKIGHMEVKGERYLNYGPWRDHIYRPSRGRNSDVKAVISFYKWPINSGGGKQVYPWIKDITIIYNKHKYKLNNLDVKFSGVSYNSEFQMLKRVMKKFNGNNNVKAQNIAEILIKEQGYEL